MNTVTAQDIKGLRAKTGAGLMACKLALEECEGDEGAAAALLKERGLVEIQRRSGRETREGRVFLHREAGRASLLALGCETDFVARNESFCVAGARMAALAWAGALTSPSAEILAEAAELAGIIKENIVVKEVALLEAGPGELLDSYLHGIGEIGALVKAQVSDIGKEGKGPFAPLLHDLALHVSAFAPRFVDQAEIPPAYRAEREAEFRAEMEAEEGLRGKAERLLEGILAGKLRKHLASICLLDQRFVKDETITVAEALRRAADGAGGDFSITGFARLAIADEKAATKT